MCDWDPAPSVSGERGRHLKVWITFFWAPHECCVLALVSQELEGFWARDLIGRLKWEISGAFRRHCRWSHHLAATSAAKSGGGVSRETLLHFLYEEGLLICSSVYSTHPPTEGATPALKREHSETPLLTPRYMCTFYKGDPWQGAKGGPGPTIFGTKKIQCTLGFATMD